ncbi:hypothetical protein [Microbacterium lacticum]|uniref:hypothetical protein n=1 Tax=Microbacterium lacticum TaxID=33885 RepID=UPI001F57F88C|nr:hypothetical protein [Microbacterium lacticum]
MTGYLAVTDERTLTSAGVAVVAKDFVPWDEYAPPSAPLAQAPTAPTINLWTYGDSWTGPKIGYATVAWPAATRDLLFLGTLTNRGQAGSRIQNIAVHAQAPTGAPWTPGTKGIVAVGGLLNQQVEGDTAANRDTAYASLRALTARLSSGVIREDTDPAFTFNGTWDTFTDPMASGGTARSVNPTLAADATHTATVTVNVPAGVNYLQLIGMADTVGKGATFTLHDGADVEVARQRTDAHSVPTLSQGIGEGARAPVVMRVPGTAGGTFTLKVTTPSGYAGAVLGYVDCLITLADEPPLVVLLKPVHVTHPSYQKEALETYLRSLPETMASEFPNVVTVDPNLGFDNVAMLGPDLLHPFDNGHLHVATAVRDAVNATAIRRALIQQTPGLVA